MTGSHLSGSGSRLTVGEMGRVAVLYAFREGSTFPIGVAIEYSRQVTISVPAYFRFPAYYRAPFTVGGVDAIGPQTVSPGEPEYFERVLEDISRTFPVRPITPDAATPASIEVHIGAYIEGTLYPHMDADDVASKLQGMSGDLNGR